MNITVVPADHGAVGHYRAVWPARAIQDAHATAHDVRIVAPHHIRFGLTRSRATVVDGIPHDTEVVVFQRMGRPEHLAGIQWLQRQGVAVVIDYDDAMWAIDRDNGAWRGWNGGESHWQWADKIAAQADLVTVTTRTLANRYGRHGRVEILPNYLPPGALAEGPQDPDNPVRVGWAGTLMTHPRDLPEASDGIRWLVEESGAVVTIVGDGRGVTGQWDIPAERLDIAGVVPFTEYHEALDQIDVGLVPLRESTFNDGKSWLKALEYAGRGIPVIASATPANRELAGRVPILLAETRQDWAAQIRNVLDGYGDLAEATWKAAHDLTIGQHAHRWAAAWERAGERRRNIDG